MSINFTNTWTNNNTNQDGNIQIYTQPSDSVANTSNFTLSCWFKTSIVGGKLIGSENSTPGGANTNYDRMVYMGSNGAILFGVYTGSVQTCSTTATGYADGNWHFVCASQNSTTGLRLNVDGGPTYTNGSTTAENQATRRWVCGFGNCNGWTNFPAVWKLRGSMQDIRVYNRALSINEASTLYYSKGVDNIKEGLHLRWLLDDGNGNFPTTIADISNSGTYGTIYRPGATMPVYDTSIISTRRRVAT